MADFERRQLEIGLEFVHWSFAERNNFSEGSSKAKKDAQVIQVWGRQPHEFFNSNYLFEEQEHFSHASAKKTPLFSKLDVRTHKNFVKYVEMVTGLTGVTTTLHPSS